MGYEGADWLDRPERVKSEQPDRVVEALSLSPGSTVADIGAGTGFFTLRLARQVGPTGRVIATDLQPAMLARLQANVAHAALGNVVLVQATETDEKLPDNSIDLALMVDVYHELSRPRETLAQVRRALRPSGRLTLVEYRGEDPSVPIKAEHKMTLAQVELEVEGEGYRLAQVLEFLPQQRIIVFTVAPGSP
jgi:ubiquinone/menaquinone biosynthesis C-methylase UbiE